MFLRSVGVSPDGRRLVVYVPTLKAFRLVETERGERLLTIPLGDGNIPAELELADCAVVRRLRGGGECDNQRKHAHFPLPSSMHRMETPLR